MCLKKIIREFELPCPNNCGAKAKKGDLHLHLKDCPEKLFECAECGEEFKKAEFREHIQREHQETMF
jgi:hypothetical protein